MQLVINCMENPPKKIITSKEYLLQGFADQFANLSAIFADDLYKIVFCILGGIRKKNKKLLQIFLIINPLTYL